MGCNYLQPIFIYVSQIDYYFTKAFIQSDNK